MKPFLTIEDLHVHAARAGHLVADLEAAWAAASDDEWGRWQRDRGLLRVAAAARAARRARAWELLAGAAPPPASP